jgi:hypothetical protein
MTTPRTKAILEVLRRGREEQLAQKVLRIFGASSIGECLTTYDTLGKAERAGIDEARMTAGASAGFHLSVDTQR